MAKIKTTKKTILNSGADVYRVGYCKLQYLLRGFSPFAYSTRCEGWACDYYNIDGVIISTGYTPIGKKADSGIVSKYEKIAKKIIENSNFTDYEKINKQLKEISSEFIKELQKND